MGTAQIVTLIILVIVALYTILLYNGLVTLKHNVGRRIIGGRLDGTPGRGADRERELLHAPVAVLDLPRHHALFLFPEHPDAVAQRGEVRIAARVDCVPRAGLHARE